MLNDNSMKNYINGSEEQTAYVEITDDIRVAVIPQVIEQESDPQRSVFAFAYTVNIDNLSSDVVQLLARHWIVMSGGVQMADIQGPGVIGEQPILKPGESYQYTSMVEIEDPVGQMFGAYIFQDQEEEVFEVVIPRFDLVYASMVQ